MTVTDQHIRALTFLACAARPTNAPQWDEAGIAAAIAKVRHLDLAELITAVGRAAGDRSLRTPAPIGDSSSSAWRERNLENAAAANRKPDPWNPGEFCTVCNRRDDGRHPEDHRFQSEHDRRRELGHEADTEADRIAKAVDWARQGIGDAKAVQEPRPEPEPLPPMPEVERLRALNGGRPDLPPEDRADDSCGGGAPGNPVDASPTSPAGPTPATDHESNETEGVPA